MDNLSYQIRRSDEPAPSVQQDDRESVLEQRATNPRELEKVDWGIEKQLGRLQNLPEALSRNLE